MMALRGVRSSWLMLARNWLLARLAISAASRALSNSRISLPMSSTSTSLWCAGRPELWRAGRQIPLAELDPSNPRYPIEDAAGGDMPGGAWAEQQNAFFLDGSTSDGRLKPGPCAIN